MAEEDRGVGRQAGRRRACEVQGKRPIDDDGETVVELKCAVVSSMAHFLFRVDVDGVMRGNYLKNKRDFRLEWRGAISSVTLVLRGGAD